MWKRRILPILVGVAAVLILAGVRVADPYPTQVLREIAFDNFQRVAPRESAGAPIRIVDIDDASLGALGQWPWPRDRMAQLTHRLTELGAASIAFDILFPEPDRLSLANMADEFAIASIEIDVDPDTLPDFDELFSDTLSVAPSVLGFGATPTEGEPPTAAKSGFAVVGPDPAGHIPPIKGAVNSLPLLTEAAKGLGSISLAPGGDVGTIRRIPLLWTQDGALFPALSLESLRLAMQASTIVVFSDASGSGEVESVRVGGFEVPTDTDGAMRIYYHPSDPDLYVPAAEILGDNYRGAAPLIAGHIVLIGTSATGLLDIRGTALGTSMPGVEIHAQALDQMISGKFLLRADWVNGLELLTFVALGLTMVFMLIWAGPFSTVAVGGLAAALIVGGTWLAFKQWGLLIDPTFPAGAALLVYTAMIFFRFLITDSDKRMIRRAFGHYVAPSLLQKIEASSQSVALGGEERDLSVLFLDVRNFTTLSEGLQPTELVHLLNKMFGALGACITEQSGTIDKFIGDAIMAFWNAPVDVEAHARHACVASLHMREKLKQLNANDEFGLAARHGQVNTIAIGVGIATGKALVGNLGLETRFDYSCIGNTVNVASRVEDACKPVDYDIVVSGSTRDQVTDLAFLEAGTIALKGRTSREPIHILVGDETYACSEGFAKLQLAYSEALSLLREGSDPSPAIERCIDLAPADDQNLRRYFARIESRRDDFQLTGELPPKAEGNSTVAAESTALTPADRAPQPMAG